MISISSAMIVKTNGRALKEETLLELDLLGTPTVRIDGKVPDISPFGKELALLYYLATSGQPQSRSSLAVLLWGDLSDVAARGNLRKALSTLRQHFDAWIVLEHELVGLVLDQVQCDVLRFEQVAHEALTASDDAGFLQSTIDLYRGDFLAGFAVRNAPDYDLWLSQARERLRGVAVGLLVALAEVHGSRSAYVEAAHCLKRILVMEPWREDIHRRLMTALAAGGQRSTALHQYKICADTLAAELGVEPSTETLELYEQIRSSRFRVSVPVQRAAPPAQTQKPSPMLSAELTPIVGRDRELDELAALLATPDCRLISIVGPGGIGKSRLALAVAHRQKADFDVVAMLSVATINSAADLLPSIARTLGIDEPAIGVADSLATRGGRTLLVLDNFEHLLSDGTAVLEGLLRTAQDLICIITTREALAVSWEWRYDLYELGYPASSDDDYDPTAYGAVQLFLQVARRTRAAHAVGRQELPCVVQICRLVGGMPLGIELAAAQIGRLPCALIARELAAGLHILEAVQPERLHAMAPRQRSLAASFEASWIALSSEEQRVLATLAVVNGEFTIDAALSIADTTIASLLRLVDKSLIRLLAADRYAVHAVIRQLAEGKLAEMADTRAVADTRYRRYYVGLFKWPSPALLAQLANTSDLMGYLQTLHGHLRTFWERSSDVQDAEAIAPAMAVTHAILDVVGWNRATMNAEGDADRSARILRKYELAASMFELLAAVDSMDHLEQQKVVFRSSYSASRRMAYCDVVWLPTFGAGLLNLASAFPNVQDQLLPAIADCYSVDGRLVAIPYTLDLGILYYRRDLLERHGFGEPPRTWTDLEHMAQEIQARERAAGKSNFWGFIWQGLAGEDIVANAIEWQYAEGGGTILSDDGTVTIHNPGARRALHRARSWLGTISPPQTSQYHEGHCLWNWHQGNAAFMRLWSVSFPVLDETVIGDLSGVTVLPAGSAGHAGVLGGWPLGVRLAGEVSHRSIALIDELTSASAQRQRALMRNPYPPTLRALYDDPEIKERVPLLQEILVMVEGGGLAIRPAKAAGKRYTSVSRAYSNAVRAVLFAGVDAEEALADLEQVLIGILQ